MYMNFSEQNDCYNPLNHGHKFLYKTKNLATHLRQKTPYIWEAMVNLDNFIWEVAIKFLNKLFVHTTILLIHVY